MPRTQHMLTAREAARVLGVSYPAIKQWILSGKLATTKTPGGHHRIQRAPSDLSSLPMRKSQHAFRANVFDV